ncbi:hypothetical protein FisN_10Lu418 [Fistulifera solaris]|uniref:Uncharacterized protein n=1 Tax=Fistulifera solaris TaxID=1519565 RepID=A0A1Z5JUV5_FISSO|nr:hypothetical protein FisN_10Lu418 [Fistulifera solaris]|eukprot:GAX17699.1 hypothetical protein FisN_10Lu418 [Fistulifera solaris]
MDSCGQRFTKGSSIDKLYALNAFYRGSTSLQKEPDSLRSSLVGSALTESSSANFQYTALLLANHADKMCELLDGFTLESVDDAGQAMEEYASPVAAPFDSLCSEMPKRKSSFQSTTSTKKVASDTRA